MTITAPATMHIIPHGDFIQPAMGASSLLKVLENANHAYLYHQPALVSACFSAGRGIDPTLSTFIVPVLPSADGLEYGIAHTFIADTIGTLTRTVYSNTGTDPSTGWSLVGADSSATAAGVRGFVDDGPYVIPSNTTMLKVTYAHGSDKWSPHHLLVYPKPSSLAAGLKSSGFYPFDDGLISHASGDASIHTEWLNRCKVNALALMSDRRQCAVSFLDDYDFREMVCGEYSHASYTGSQTFLLPTARVHIQGRGPQVVIDLKVVASVDGGATANLIRVQQKGMPGGASNAAPAFFAADGQLQSGQITVDCGLVDAGAYADLEIAVIATSGQKTRLHSLVGFI